MARKVSPRTAKSKAAADQAPATANTQPGGGAQAAARTGKQPQQAGAPGAPAAQNATPESAVKAGAAHSGAASQAAPEFDAVAVVGPKKGRWRAGRHFTPEVTIIPLAELNETELAALKGDPYLVVGDARLSETED